MYYMYGGSDDQVYYRNNKEQLSNVYYYDENNKYHKWVWTEWDSICEKLKIRDFQRINWNKPKITIGEFMTILKDNQDNFKTT